MLDSEFLLMRRDVEGQPRNLRLHRVDIPASQSLDPDLRQWLLSAVLNDWRPTAEARKALWDRAPDLSEEWDWDGTLASDCRHLVTEEPQDCVLIFLTSINPEGTVRLEGLARLIDGWSMIKHKPRQSGRRREVRLPPMGVYLDALAVHPTNRRNVPPPPRIRELGAALLAAALAVAAEPGRQGFLAFHAAPEARSWYEQELPGIVFSTDREEFGMAETGKAPEGRPDGESDVDATSVAPYAEVSPVVARDFVQRRFDLLDGFERILPQEALDRFRAKCEQLSNSEKE